MKIVAIICGVAVAIAVIVGAVIYYIRDKQRVRQQAIDSIRDRIVRAIKKGGYDPSIVQEFNDEFSDERHLVTAAVEDVYAMACRNASKDGVIDEDDAKRLSKLEATLKLDSSRCKAILASSALDKVKDRTKEILAQGVFTDLQVKELRELKEKLNLGNVSARNVLADEVVDAYVVLFRKVIKDGKITPEELEELKSFQDAMDLSKKEANSIIRNDAMKLYSRWFYSIVQDGVITVEEERTLDWLRDTFDLDSPEVRRFENQMRAIKQAAAYRKGNLPSVDTDKMLESGEICHWESACTFCWLTPTMRKRETGELLITSRKIIFTSPSKSFNFSPSSIIDVVEFSDAVELKTAGSKGTGTYLVRNPTMLEAIITGVARKHKYTAVNEYSSELSRHIPDHVRSEVWYRDGGKCVRCAACEYLEFDHIIPFSKGGANTVNNVQLLCRKCNNYKSDRI